MSPITRSAARAASESVEALGLRSDVSRKSASVWEYRNVDVYTGRHRGETPFPQVDHCLEVQIGETALVRAYESVSGRTGSMATVQAHSMLRDVLNDVPNLNVTTRAINCAKRGPFTAALNRLRSDSLRDVTLEQLARQGKARTLVDDGTWARIETAIVNAYDSTSEQLNDAPALLSASELTARTMDELCSILTRLGAFNG